MALYVLSLLLLLLLFTTAATTATATSTSTISPTTTSDLSNSNTTTTTRLPRPLQVHSQQQLNNVIDALIGAGDFNTWVNILSDADPTTLPLSATLFIPADDSPSPMSDTITIDPFNFPYHIVPQRLSFADLRQFSISSRLPTLLSSKTILITNNSVSNFTLDGSLLSHPDLFTGDAIAVHGIATLLDYLVYGDPNPTKPPNSQPEVLPRPPPGMFVPKGELITDHVPESADVSAACSCSEVFWTIFLVLFCAVFLSKIQRMCLCY